MFVIANILDEKVMAMAREVTTNSANAIDEEIFPDPKPNGYCERRKQEAAQHDDERKAMMSARGEVNLAVLLSGHTPFWHLESASIARSGLGNDDHPFLYHFYHYSSAFVDRQLDSTD